MTNKERIISKGTKEFWKEIELLMKNPFSKHIDYVSFLDSEEEDITKFIGNIGKARLVSAAGYDTDECLLLEEKRFYGEKYYAVADVANNRLLSVPAKKLIIEGE